MVDYQQLLKSTVECIREYNEEDAKRIRLETLRYEAALLMKHSTTNNLSEEDAETIIRILSK